MEKKEKKEISIATSVKAIITGYIAYGILMGFLVFVFGVVVNGWINSLPNANSKLLAVTIPLIGVILLYFVLHAVCKLSIYDVFKKCKTKAENLPKVFSRMNLFVLICVAFYVISSIAILNINFTNQEQSIALAAKKYSNIHSAQFTSVLTHKMVEEYQETKSNMIISAIILELGIVVSWLSIIPLQKKLIKKYNEV